MLQYLSVLNHVVYGLTMPGQLLLIYVAHNGRVQSYLLFSLSLSTPGARVDKGAFVYLVYFGTLVIYNI